MEKIKQIEMLEEILELENGTLKEDTQLSSLDEWDSVAALSLIVLFDEEFNKTITGKEIKEFKLVSDILKLMHK